MLKFFNNSDYKLCSSTQTSVQILTIDPKDKKIRLVDSNLGNIKRSFSCLAVDANDEYVYAGTKTGDILEIDLDKAIFKRVAPCYNLFSNGVKTIHTLPNKDLLIGAGDGTLAKISIQNMMIKAYAIRLTLEQLRFWVVSLRLLLLQTILISSAEQHCATYTGSTQAASLLS